MDFESMKRKYAYTLARVGLNVQKGQTVLVEAAIEGWQFTSVFAEECYKLGAGNVVVHYLDLPNMKIAAQYRSDEEVRHVEDWEYAMHQGYLDEGACYVRLEGVNPKLMEGVSEKKFQRHFRPCGQGSQYHAEGQPGEALPVADCHGTHGGMGGVHPEQNGRAGPGGAVGNSL